jgi:hypothetical protein
MRKDRFMVKKNIHRFMRMKGLTFLESAAKLDPSIQTG